ncbi:efflux RND transporter periplasmic adaptor subunit [Ideonella sp. DXS29W]|uniref:Efflux RND transporter periplasmic adaptor subunit n=1 Tax=Ideonella lacteola TaxID=2984193 RepID=A0ABU9BLW0_9BURK
MNKPLFVATVLSLSVLGLVGCAKKEAPPEPVRAVRTITVNGSETVAAHEYAAEIRARTESRLGFRVGGKLQSRAVNLGDSVKAGQVLAQLDGQDLRLGQEAARAAVAAAQTNLDQVTADYKRFKELRDQGFIGAAELERRETAVKTARAQLDQAKAQASVQGNQAGYATLVADAAGVVTAVEAEPGQVVSAGTPVVRLAHDGPRDAVFSVPEDRVGDLRQLLGKAGGVTLQPWGEGPTVPASVREVAAAADPVTRTFLVKADLGNASVRLGQTANVRIAGQTVAGVIRLPLTAVAESKGQTVVWMLDRSSMTVRSQPVVVGGADGNTVVIGQGVKPGDEVVVAGIHVLTPGLKVKPYVETQVASAAKAVPASASIPAPAASR